MRTRTRPLALLILLAAATSTPAQPIDIADRLELFVDGHLVDKLTGQARRVIGRPTAREIVLACDQPWEGNSSAYFTVFRDGDRYRMYYRGLRSVVRDGKVEKPHRQVTCYAESGDGVTWTKPQLGLFEFDGSKQNNIVWDGPGTHNFAPFKDSNPDCAADARYKALARGEGRFLIAYKSADGIHWSLMRDEPVITQGAFDSQNLAFWDAVRGEYRAYFRDFRDGVRDIKTSTSSDFLNWSDPQWLSYDDAPKEHLYTNQVAPYFRAPHIFIGMPTRYIDRGWQASTKVLPDAEHRTLRAKVNRRYGTAVSETLLMSSRDGMRFDRWAEAFVRPGPQRPDSWAYGNNYTAWHVVPTPSHLPGAADELSLYATEGYWTDSPLRLRRYTLRQDGFVRVTAPMAGGELLTKPLRFKGDRLTVNFATSAAGTLRVELRDADGKPINGFTLADCDELFGDEIERTVTWKGKPAVGSLAGKAMRVRFVLNDADLYSFRFW